MQTNKLTVLDCEVHLIRENEIQSQKELNLLL